MSYMPDCICLLYNDQKLQIAMDVMLIEINAFQKSFLNPCRSKPSQEHDNDRPSAACSNLVCIRRMASRIFICCCCSCYRQRPTCGVTALQADWLKLQIQYREYKDAVLAYAEKTYTKILLMQDMLPC